MIPSNVIRRVFHLKHGNQSATGFAIDVDGKCYLVTARHFGGSIVKCATVQCQHDGAWKDLPVREVGHAAKDIDISVLAPPVQLLPPGYTIESDMGGIVYGQEIFFLGYPYGLAGEIGDLHQKFPLPFVKRGIVSCLETRKDVARMVLLDGINNQGFSGGPVVFKHTESKKFKIASVISGFKAFSEPVFQGDTPLAANVRTNTGIIDSYSIEYAVELARANPIGPVIHP